MDVAGLEQTIGSFADGANVVISLLRAALEKEKDERKKHLLNAAISGVSIIPFGDLAKVIKLRLLRKPAVKLLRFIKNYLKSEKPSYHDLSHLGLQRKKLGEVTLEKDLEEGWKDWVAASSIGLSALKGGNLQGATLNAKPVIPKTVQINLDQSFVDYIKRVENGVRAGYNKNKKLWFPHHSFEGGSDTIGYGHKIQSEENFSNGITDVQAEALLRKDLQKAQFQVFKELNGRQLTKKQMEMFVDFVFNMGTLKKFPKFTQAALRNDLTGMKDQYKRSSGGRELKGRNNAFLQRFLTEYFA